jgi:hypothetical protein
MLLPNHLLSVEAVPPTASTILVILAAVIVLVIAASIYPTLTVI